jgi:Tol biopolymer transport system component/DNA-binding winged helix-turn-helix (wHTH) protein
MIPSVMRFADFELDLSRYELRQAGRRVDLQRIPMDLLILLAERDGALVTRDDIVARLWGADALTDTERSINTAIRKIRQALGDDASQSRFVETVVGKGYRFVAPVSFAGPSLTPTTAPPVNLAASATRASEEVRLLEFEPPAFTSESTRGIGAWRSVPKWLLVGVSLTIAALALISARHDNLPPIRIKPFTGISGIEANPSFSADGSQVAFCLTQRNGSQHVYRKTVGTGSPEQLTNGPERDSNPSWSRDGKSIAFLRRDATGALAVYVMSATGGPTVMKTALTQPREHRPSWSTDGKSLAIIDSLPGETQASIFLLSLESGQKRRLIAPSTIGTGDWDAAYSPDGHWLAFVRNTGAAQSSQLYELPVDSSGAATGPERVIRTARADLKSLEWSADGRSLLCETEGGLVRISLDGKRLEQLPFPDATQPSAAPAGNRLVYVRSTRVIDIFAVPGPAGAGSAVDVITSARMDGAPSYSSDGKRIAFVSNRTGSLEIWASNADGQQAAQLTTSAGATVGCPRWSPDGRNIAFDSTDTAGSHIFIISAKGDSLRRITSGASRNVRPSWSRDGRWIYFGSNRSGLWQIWKISPDGTAAVQVTHNGGREAFEDFEGRFLYYAKESSVSGIWRLPVSGGDEVKITDRGFQGRWALAEHGLYYLKGETEIERLGLPDQRVIPISTAGLALATGTGGLLAIGPGERSILVTASVRTESELIMVEGFR